MKKIIKKIAVTIGLAGCCFSLLAAPAATMPVRASVLNPAIMPMSDVVYWIYKTENGKLYKRLYNATTGRWVSGWIFVRNL